MIPLRVKLTLKDNLRSLEIPIHSYIEGLEDKLGYYVEEERLKQGLLSTERIDKAKQSLIEKISKEENPFEITFVQDYSLNYITDDLDIETNDWELYY